MKGVLVRAGVAVALAGAAWASLEWGRAADPPAPEFAGVSEWVNGKEVKLADQKGKVLVVHFFTTGCINCVHNYPRYRALQDKYKGEKEFVLVGVHTPEFDSEKDVTDLKAKLAKNKLTFPVAVDNDAKTWKAWGNRYWPCAYVVDKAGVVRYKVAGELGDDGYKTLTKQIDDLLAEPSRK